MKRNDQRSLLHRTAATAAVITATLVTFGQAHPAAAQSPPRTLPPQLRPAPTSDRLVVWHIIEDIGWFRCVYDDTTGRLRYCDWYA